MEDIAKEVQQIILHPKQFLDDKLEDHELVKPLLFFIGANLITLLTKPFVFIASAFYDPASAILNLFGYMVSFIPKVFGLFILIFVASGLAHLGLMLFGAKEGYIGTFKVIGYSGVIFSIYTIIANFLLAVGIALLHLNQQTAISILVSGLLAATLITGFIHQIIFLVMGLSNEHQISYAKAFFGMLLVPGLLAILITGILIALFGLLFFAWLNTDITSMAVSML